MQTRFLLGKIARLLILLLILNRSAPAQETSTPSASKLDFGDATSSTITTKAWDALNAKHYADAIAYASKCIELFKAKALDQQKHLTAPLTEKAAVFAQSALNDVGTCFYIQAKAREAQGDAKAALDSYKFLTANLAFAQCWDPHGWFWKPADAARERINALEFDALQ